MTSSKTIRSWSDIPGFFRWVDRWMFATLLEAQRDSEPGNLVELGTYQAKSAVIIGSYLRPGERFVALDLFGREDLFDFSASGTMNRDENRRQYKGLNRLQFEQNYLALHSTLPEIHEGLSTDIVDLVEPASVRFIHVDAGHMYDQVRLDVTNAKSLLRPGGIVAYDDFRTEHTPGVSAAVWEAVFNDGLVPVAVTPRKMYAVYEGTDPEPYQEAVRAFVNGDHAKWWMQEQSVLGRPLLRVKHKDVAPTPAAAPAAAPARPKPSAGQGAKKASPRPAAAAAPKSLGQRVKRRIARDIAPPMFTRWVRSRRQERSWPKPTKL